MKNSLTNRSKFKLAGLSAILAAAFLTGCLEQNGPAASGEGDVAVKLRMGMGSVTELHKTALIKKKDLIIVYSSSANDTIRDTVKTPTIDTVATSQQTITRTRTLTALRTWKIVVTSRDRLDSAIHKDSATIPAMYAGDTAVVNLNMSSRFSMYEALFMNLPDSIQSATPSQPKQVLCINRLRLLVDGAQVRDSTATPGPCFTKLATHTLAYDYVKTGSRTIQMLAYGPMNFWNVANPLYSGSTVVNTNAGVDTTVNINLAWVGPTTGVGKLTVQLGRVGKVTVNGTLPGTI